MVDKGNKMTREALIAKADALLAKYPQYKGAFDKYVLVRIKKNVRTKAGLSFSKDEITIAERITSKVECGPNEGKEVRFVFSFKTTFTTSVFEKDIEVL